MELSERLTERLVNFIDLLLLCQDQVTNATKLKLTSVTRTEGFLECCHPERKQIFLSRREVSVCTARGCRVAVARFALGLAAFEKGQKELLREFQEPEIVCPILRITIFDMERLAQFIQAIFIEKPCD